MIKIIKITSRKLGYECLAETEILESKVKKRDRSVTTSISGHNKESYVRALKTISSINITYMTEAMYEILEDIYQFDNLFDITDNSSNKTYSKVYIDVDEFGLTPKYDRVKNQIFYSGTITLNAR